MRPLAASSITSREMLVSWKAQSLQVLGAAQGGQVVWRHAHHQRHHHPHHAGDVPAVVERVLEGLVAAAGDVHGEAIEELGGVALGDAPA